MRASWRAPEQQRLQEAIRGLMTLATTRAEVAQRVLGPVAALVGARAACIFDADGNVLAQQWVPEQTVGVEPVRVEEPGVVLHVWTSPYAPFFGEDELRTLQTVAALTGIALDRVRLFEQEHQSRLALERANELMTNFVALAAHELRTPVTTVHGFVQTLNHLGDRLDESQKDELRLALEQQTTRMAALVEQLLDLSRLDAEAVEVKPQELDLRQRLEEVVAVAAGSRLADVRVEVLGPAVAVVDPSILDHIVTNLVTNALRYGQAPVLVSAVVDDGQVRISVEDAGPGVAFEIEETLFERFTRAGVARDRVAGTGLGLAIARAYARAHSGDLRYERGQPGGARFVVELPTAADARHPLVWARGDDLLCARASPRPNACRSRSSPTAPASRSSATARRSCPTAPRRATARCASGSRRATRSIRPASSSRMDPFRGSSSSRNGWQSGSGCSSSGRRTTGR